MNNATHTDSMDRGKPNEVATPKKNVPRTTTLSAFQSFLENTTSGKTAPVPTGCTVLDEHLRGGLRNELYILRAEPGAGKTTLCLSMLPRFAAEKRDVLFISLDMSKDQILGKIASRLSYDLPNEKTPLEYYDVLDLTDTDYAGDLIAAYTREADYTTIYDRSDIKSMNDITIAIEEIGFVAEYPPIVIIDYLQILAAMHETATERDAVEKALNFCREIISKYNTPMILISSISRNAYGKKLSLSSCKESGSIEYAADYVIGLERNIDAEQSCDGDLRPITMKFFKSRFAISMAENNLYMVPKYNLYLMASSAADEADHACNTEAVDDEYKLV